MRILALLLIFHNNYYIGSWIYKIIQVGSNHWRSLVQPPAQTGSAMSSDQAAQGLIQSGLENFQGWSWHSLSGQPAPLPACPHRENSSPYIQPEPLVL